MPWCTAVKTERRKGEVIHKQLHIFPVYRTLQTGQKSVESRRLRKYRCNAHDTWFPHARAFALQEQCIGLTWYLFLMIDSVQHFSAGDQCHFKFPGASARKRTGIVSEVYFIAVQQRECVTSMCLYFFFVSSVIICISASGIDYDYNLSYYKNPVLAHLISKIRGYYS